MPADTHLREVRHMPIYIERHDGGEGYHGWPEFDSSLLEEDRGAVPVFPLDLVPQPWRDWVTDTARSAGVPVDYVAQAVLGALGGVCGAGVAVRITQAWFEPLVLWQALVGPRSGPSYGDGMELIEAVFEGDGSRRSRRSIVHSVAVTRGRWPRRGRRGKAAVKMPADIRS